MVPTVRFTFRIGRVSSTFFPFSIAGAQRSISVRSSALSSPWSCATTQRRATLFGIDGSCRIAE